MAAAAAWLPGGSLDIFVLHELANILLLLLEEAKVRREKKEEELRRMRERSGVGCYLPFQGVQHPHVPRSLRGTCPPPPLISARALCATQAQSPSARSIGYVPFGFGFA